MNHRESLIENSVREFKGHIPDEVKGIGIKFISEFDVKYLIFSSLVNDEIDAAILEVIQDILVSEGAVKDHLGNIDWRFDISYEILNTATKIEESIGASDFVWIYLKGIIPLPATP
jgi:hypothetical protein